MIDRWDNVPFGFSANVYRVGDQVVDDDDARELPYSLVELVSIAGEPYELQLDCVSTGEERQGRHPAECERHEERRLVAAAVVDVAGRRVEIAPVAELAEHYREAIEAWD